MKTYSRKKQGDQSEVIIHINELCRLCLVKDDELVPIFSEDDAMPLTLRIMACVSLEVFEGDGLPNMICHSCKFQLEKSYAFKKKCENSDLKLRQHLRIIQEKFGKNFLKDEANGDEAQQAEANAMLAELIAEPSGEELPGEAIGSEKELLGAQVAFIQNDNEAEDNDPEDITLPAEQDDESKAACTLHHLKRGQTEQVDDTPKNMILLNDEQVTVVEDVEGIGEQNLTAIANAVKVTLESQPGLNLSRPIQMKLESGPGRTTQVEVTTDDGAVVIMELLTEDDGQASGEAEEVDASAVEGITVSEVSQQQTSTAEEELKVFKCPDCPKAFSRRIQLRRHASVHMQQHGFSCGICEKWFPTKSALVRHERIHTGERPFQCEVCQKSFAQKEILYRHLMTHTGRKPYSCPHCQKGFTQREPLRVHMRTHQHPSAQDIQLHRCTLCPKVFCHASGLSRHLLTHTGKVYKCRDCDKSFTDKSSLRRHHKQTRHQIY